MGHGMCIPVSKQKKVKNGNFKQYRRKRNKKEARKKA
jgi:hypothetical protein